MIRSLLVSLLALPATVVAFAPAASWGIARQQQQSSTLLNAEFDPTDFEGVDLERLIGTKKMKKFERGWKRKANQRAADGAASTPTALSATASSGDVGSALKIIIAGAPASGKGTQCAIIKEKFGVVHLSTGDMLRAAVAAETDVGKQAKDFMDSGKLVPDEVIIGVVSLCTVSCIFPVSHIS